MSLIAIRMLVGDRLKYLALVLGVAFAALLITQQASIFTGYARRTGSWIRDNTAADLWVTDPNVEFSDDLKPMADTALNRVRGVDGVAWAVPMFKGYVDALLPDGSRRNIRLIGLDAATLIGGPPQMEAGSLGDLRRDRALLMNAAGGIELTRGGFGGRGLRPGDRLSLEDVDAEIVGAFRATPEFFWEPVFYATLDLARRVQPDHRRTLSYVLVKARDGVDAAALARRIEATTNLKARTSAQFERETMAWILQQTGILVNFGITIALGAVIGLLVAGQTLYMFVLDNLRHFGALKAMGLSNARLVAMMGVQVAVVTTLGFGIGLGGAAVTGAFFAGGGLAFEMPWQVPAYGFVAVGACCLLAGLLSMVRVLRLEPAVVFR